MSTHEQSEEGCYPEEDYVAMRRPKVQEDSSSEHVKKIMDMDPGFANLPYKPVTEPAWSKHRPAQGPKQGRFDKLTRWGDRTGTVKKVVTWGLVAAGAATIAGPALITHLPH
jgi:hypothetical protein